MRKLKIASFAEFLRKVEGVDYNYFDNNYGDNQVDELYDEYIYYTKHPEEYADYFCKLS